MRNLFPGLVLVSAAALATLLLLPTPAQKSRSADGRPAPTTPALSGRALHRASVDFLWETYRDPATNTVPQGMHRKVLAYVRSLPPATGKTSSYSWAEVGPFERGGRTRTVVADLDDADVLLAGGVAGGLWRSTDQGQSWSLVSSPGDMLSVTSVAQDPRPGQRNVWYCATGEYRQSAADLGQTAFDFGTGIYKSVDGGLSWAQLPVTVDDFPSFWSTPYDFVVRLVVSPATGTLFVADNGFGVLRSADGGLSFDLVLGSIGEHLWSDVAVGADGSVMAVISEAHAGTPATAFAPGVHRSLDDGVTWTDVTPATFPTVHRRSVLAVAPSNPAIAFVATNTGLTRPDGREDVRLHRFVAGVGDDRTANLPNYPGTIPLVGPSVHTQTDYCFMIAVKPDDEDFVIVGGTSLYRSTDGFATPIPATPVDAGFIGGYGGPETGGLYDGLHHPDNHTVAFHPSRPNEMLNGSDGGVYITRDVTAPHVSWTENNDGFNVTQFYTVSIADEAGDPRIMGGTQDNFVLYMLDERGSGGTFSASQNLVFGDGGFGYFGDQFVFAERQFGDVRRLDYLNPQGTQIQPEGIQIQSGGLFVHPFAVDPSDERLLYSPFNNAMYRNNDVAAADPSQNWQLLNGSAAPVGYRITAVSASTQPAHVLYFGATRGDAAPRIYRLDDADFAVSAVDISVPGSEIGAYVHGIGVNPDDAQEILVVYSNYNITGLFHSTDGGLSYTAVEGNLEGDLQNPGPSLRWASILPFGGTTRYFLATSAGLFSTTALDGSSTQWALESPDLIGDTVTSFVCSRPSDGRVAVATHGRGLFVGDPPSVVATSPPPPGPALEQNHPNPFNAATTVSYFLRQPGPVTLQIFDVRGRSVLRRSWPQHERGAHQFQWDGRNGRGQYVASGMYTLRLVTHESTNSIRMTLVK